MRNFSSIGVAGIAVAASLLASAADAKPTITTFQVPGSTNTFAWAIDGSVTGYYFDSSNIVHGFLRASDGTIATFDPGGSSDTEAYAINAAGTAAGWYIGSDSMAHGFLRASDGTITSFDPPGSTWTLAYGMNGKGASTGNYEDSGGISHGFVRTPN